MQTQLNAELQTWDSFIMRFISVDLEVIRMLFICSAVNATDAREAVSIAHRNYTSADVKRNTQTFAWWINAARTESDGSHYPQSPASLVCYINAAVLLRVELEASQRPRSVSLSPAATRPRHACETTAAVSRAWCDFKTRPWWWSASAINLSAASSYRGKSRRSVLLWYDCIVFLTFRSQE